MLCLLLKGLIMDLSDRVLDFGRRAKELTLSLRLDGAELPSGDVAFPSDLSKLHDAEIGRHLAYWASMCAYAHQKLAVLEGALILAKQELEDETQVRIYHRQDKSMAERKAAVSSMKVVRELSKQVATIEADLKVIKSVVMGYDMKNSAISREITRRTSERSIRDG